MNIIASLVIPLGFETRFFRLSYMKSIVFISDHEFGTPQ